MFGGKLSKKPRVALTGLLAFLIFFGGACRIAPQEAQRASKPLTLKYWRVFDDSDSFDDVIAAYRALHPHVQVEYRKLRPEEYERELLNALAEDRGPDIFSVHNTWMRGYQSKLLPLPPQTTVATREIQGAIKKEEVTVLRTKPSLTLRQLRNDFVDTVYADAVIPTPDEKKPEEVTDRVYGLPLFVDSLVLYYNRDLLNAAKIPQPPQTWSEFQQAVKRLTRLDNRGAILQAGAAIGSGRNVERAFDILSLLMMQNGAKMTDESGFAAFHTLPRELAGRPDLPGEGALIFYTDFANPGKDVYTWNGLMPSSFEAFVAGKSAMFLGYSYHLPLIRARAPKLNLGIAPAPQIEGNPEINFANYWIESVSRKTKNPNEAWDFVQFLAGAEQVKKYLDKARRPTALRALISGQLEDEDLAPFANQTLTAQSWYRGKDAGSAEKAFIDMIESTISGALPAREALRFTAEKVNQTIR
ncbi:extracellular solute-binding protein [Candidatus Uhrbacteria bacterium]|nr:extracellular solute-binding protein [Candidatus Uhrbacteria bacterium]